MFNKVRILTLPLITDKSWRYQVFTMTTKAPTNPIEIYLGLGSNLGDRAEALKKALKLISKRLGAIKSISEVYQTVALLKPNSPESFSKPYLNCSVKLSSSLSDAEEILTITQAIETELGREEKEDRSVWAPRIIDIDILLVGSKEISTNRLTVPHPEILNRAFVLQTLVDISSDLKCPATGLSYQEQLLVSEKINKQSPALEKTTLRQEFLSLLSSAALK